MSNERDALVKYRIAKALDTLEDARILAAALRWNPCVNRLYYACFYGVTALLLRDGLSSSKHTGVRSLFNRHYVKDGNVPRHIAQTYNDLFERRQESDYMDFIQFEEAQVLPLISKVDLFLKHIIVILGGEHSLL